MSTTPVTPLTKIATDTQSLIAALKAAGQQLSADAKAGLATALTDAHQEVVDVEGAGSSIWSALLAAITSPTSAPATK